MKIRFCNPEYEIEEIIDSEELPNDSGEELTESRLVEYIKDVCPRATNIEVF